MVEKSHFIPSYCIKMKQFPGFLVLENETIFRAISQIVMRVLWYIGGISKPFVGFLMTANKVTTILFCWCQGWNVLYWLYFSLSRDHQKSRNGTSESLLRCSHDTIFSSWCATASSSSRDFHPLAWIIFKYCNNDSRSSHIR